MYPVSSTKCIQQLKTFNYELKNPEVSLPVELRIHGGGVCILSVAIGGNAVNYIVVEGTCSDVDSPIEP